MGSSCDKDATRVADDEQEVTEFGQLRAHRILMLGAGNSGKSTIMTHLRRTYDRRLADKVRLDIIRSSIVTQMSSVSLSHSLTHSLTY